MCHHYQLKQQVMKTYKSSISGFKIVKENTEFAKVKITCSQDAYDFIKQFYSSDIAVYESFYLLLLNRANITTGYVKISQGGTAGTVVDVKIIAKYAVESLSGGVILAHNHPSGNRNPSESDRLLTDRVKNALALFDIPVLDHIILSGDPEQYKEYYSFADEGNL